MNRYMGISLLIIFTALFVFSGTTLGSPLDIDEIQDYDQNLPLTNSGGIGYKNILSWGMYIFLILGVCILAFYTTRWIGEHQKRASIRSKYLEVLDVLALGSDSKIYIIRAPQQVLLVGVSQNYISILERFNPDQEALINELEADFSVSKNFASHLEDFIRRNKDFQQEKKGEDYEV